MVDKTIVISGLPGSGKTTFLAALWHLLTSRVDETRLRFSSLDRADVSYLNNIAERWRSGKIQDRTILVGDKIVSMNLLDLNSNSIRLVFPDIAGESFRDMWEGRECPGPLVQTLRKGEGLVLFVNANTIQRHLLTVEVAAQTASLGSEMPQGQQEKWQASFAPTQVKLVDLLQLFRAAPIRASLNRVAVFLSLWDKVEIEGRAPEDFLSTELPLLSQYLQSAADGWETRVWGISAQGGDYENEKEPPTPTQRAAIKRLMALDVPSKRIKVVSDSNVSHDLTEPIAWLLG